MVRLGGTPQEIGRTWGALNRKVIARRLDDDYRQKAAAEGIAKETLIERAKPFVRIAEEIAPHWLEEARAIARAAGVDEDLYLSFIANAPRSLYLHECTSYAISREHALEGAIWFHKNRDNRDFEQAAYVLESSVPGVNKFIAVCDATALLCCMMVNDKGLAGSADYPANLTRKNDPLALLPEPAEPRYRGLMNTSLLRHVAEKASTCAEALAILEDLVKKGCYAGGKVDGTHWLFVDRTGAILEISNNAGHVASKFHTQAVYFSQGDDMAAAQRLRGASGPVDFHLFHGVSRDPSICLKSSISGMTVEIDPERPELFSCAWISFPARAVSFPLLMGQARTPACLLSGEAYVLGKGAKDSAPLWEAAERSIRASKELLKKNVPAGADARAAADTMDAWSNTQAGMLLEVLRASGAVSPTAESARPPQGGGR